MRLDPVLMDVIVCPACHGTLEPSPDGATAAADGVTVTGELVCASCAVAYPVHDDVPVLLVDYARPLTDSGTSASGAGAQ